MSLFPTSFRPLMCGLFALLSLKQPTGCAASDPELKTFQLFPEVPIVPALTADAALQFNGSAPGQGAVPEQLGWWPAPTPDVTEKQPIKLTAFVQNNADEGIVFWAQRTAFTIYLAPTKDSKKTFSVELGNPKLEPRPQDTLSRDFTITRLARDDGDGAPKYAFGYDGDYESWFVCGGKKGDGEVWQLYYGERIRGCSERFALDARYL